MTLSVGLVMSVACTKYDWDKWYARCIPVSYSLSALHYKRTIQKSETKNMFLLSRKMMKIKWIPLTYTLFTVVELNLYCVFYENRISMLACCFARTAAHSRSARRCLFRVRLNVLHGKHKHFRIFACALRLRKNIAACRFAEFLQACIFDLRLPAIVRT